ncbi:MAG: DNA polymerase-3 subunit chi [Pseudohongiellaceae bacterium]|jgi:DNA polymerase-3 subunit chi
MTQIDFYVLTQTTAIARLHYACRLTEKAVNQGCHIAIALDDELQAQTLSDYLWSFKPESFLPHTLQNDEAYIKALEAATTVTEKSLGEAKRPTPIALIWSEDNEHYHDILINLSQKIPEGFSRYRRAFEIVVQEDDCLRITRSHFQFYRERGYPLKSHAL